MRWTKCSLPLLQGMFAVLLLMRRFRLYEVFVILRPEDPQII